MRLEVFVRFADSQELTLHADDPLPLREAREWLDRECLALEFVPQRASGKVLTADKLLGMARAVGPAGFADAAWAAQFARAAAGALGKTLVRVDVAADSVSY